MTKSLAFLLVILTLPIDRAVRAATCRDSASVGEYTHYAVAFQIGTTEAVLYRINH